VDSSVDQNPVKTTSMPLLVPEKVAEYWNSWLRGRAEGEIIDLYHISSIDRASREMCSIN